MKNIDPELKAKALDDLIKAYKTYTLEQLAWDWSCNIDAESREVLRQEFERRGLTPSEGTYVSDRSK